MADTTSLHLRLPKSLYKRLQRQARRNNVSLNTEIVNQLSNPKQSLVPVLPPPEAIPILRKEMANFVAPILDILRKEIETLVRDVRVAQAESEKRSQDMPTVLEREKGEEQK